MVTQLHRVGTDAVRHGTRWHDTRKGAPFYFHLKVILNVKKNKSSVDLGNHLNDRRIKK